MPFERISPAVFSPIRKGLVRLLILNSRRYDFSEVCVEKVLRDSGNRCEISEL